MPFFSSVANYFRKRRRGFAIAVGLAGGAYLVAHYALERFREAQARIVRSKNAKANLVRRFLQNQEDCVLTVSALLTTLSAQIFDEISVESITEQLQKLASGRPAGGEESNADQQQPSHSQSQTPLPPSPPRSPLEDNQGTEERNMEDKEADNHPENDDSFTSAYDKSTSTIAPTDSHHGYTTDSSDSAASYHIPPSTISDATTAHSNGDDDRTPIIGVNSGVIVKELDGVPHSPVSEGTIKTPAFPPPSKAELWNQIKILSFTRAVTSVYTVCLLVLQTNVQLNLLGRYKYVGSVVAQVQNSRLDGPIRLVGGDDSGNNESENGDHSNGSNMVPSAMDDVTERAYLTFSWWLLYKGWRDVRDKVQDAVEEALADKQLKTEISNDDFVRIISKIRQKVECNATGSPQSFSSALFPDSKESESEVLRNGGLPEIAQNIDSSPQLRQLLDETADILDCPDFVIVQQACFDAVFGVFLSSLDSSFFLPRDMTSTTTTMRTNGFGHPRITEIKNTTCRLASVLPTISKEAHTILRGLPNEYAECCSNVRELKEFSAIIYSAWEAEDVDLFNS